MSGIRLTAHGLAGIADLRQLSAEFERTHTARLPGLIDPPVLQVLRKTLDSTPWQARDHGKIGRELKPQDRNATAALHFLVNVPDFLRLVREITGCGAARRFAGRIYRLPPTPEYFDRWHDDVADDRMIGMSINLSPEPYEGGGFRLRDRRTHEVLSEIHSIGPGDAHLFRISSKLQHVVTAVGGAKPKTAFAGWFGPSPADYFSTILGLRR